YQQNQGCKEPGLEEEEPEDFYTSWSFANLVVLWRCWDTEAVSVSLSSLCFKPRAIFLDFAFFFNTHPPAPRGLAKVSTQTSLPTEGFDQGNWLKQFAHHRRRSLADLGWDSSLTPSDPAWPCCCPSARTSPFHAEVQGFDVAVFSQAEPNPHSAGGSKLNRLQYLPCEL
ncbi:hypothetical protein EK904_015139, partial [Melospiza melodia maxima]